MFVHFGFGDGGGVHHRAGAHHGVGEDGGFFRGHSLEVNGNGHGGQLVVGDGAGGEAVDEEADFFIGQNMSVAFFFNNPFGNHESLQF